MTQAQIEMKKLKAKHDSFMESYRDQAFDIVRDFLLEKKLNNWVITNQKTDYYVGKIFVDEVEEIVEFRGRDIYDSSPIILTIDLELPAIVTHMQNGTFERLTKVYREFEVNEEDE